MAPVPTLNEVLYDGRVMITETDLNGVITFVNRKFVEMSAYSRDELLGCPHSIIRHPDMPRVCFEQMWKSLREGQSWQGYVKNLRSDGAYYWVVVHICPKFVEGTKVGYIAARKRPDLISLPRVKQAYEQALDLEQQGNLPGARHAVAHLGRINASSFPCEVIQFA